MTALVDRYSYECRTCHKVKTIKLSAALRSDYKFCSIECRKKFTQLQKAKIALKRMLGLTDGKTQLSKS
jgi:hypothetical protein